MIVWNENSAVQVVAWRMLSRLRAQDGQRNNRHDTLKICYAQATGEGEDDENKLL
jgi:protein PhnA